ncbi:hypothetical protein M413DRAFT_68711, partial [Hebeloma cylindrosporum]
IMYSINDDVLRLILDFMSPEDIHGINSTNRVVYEKSMKSRYELLEITKRDKPTKVLLTHLCESDVGRYVKKVKIRPWLVHPHTNSPRSITEKAIVRFMEVAVDPHYTRKTAEARLQKRLRKDTTRITTAFKSMSMLQEFEIDWDDTREFHPEFFRAFLAPPLASWQSHLTSLTVKVPLSLVFTLASVRLPYLQSFTFHFTTAGQPEQEINHAHDGFLVFVNNLKDSLQSLTFTSTFTSQNLNLCYIFDHMGVFPSLRKISLSIPFEGGHLPEPMSFVQFVMKHSKTLNHMDLFTSRCVMRWTPSRHSCFNWIQNILGSIPERLPLLRGLGVALRPLRAPLTIVTQFLTMHPDIETLYLEDRALETTQISQLFPQFFAQPVVDILHFQAKVESLTPDLLAYFAFKFPNLQTLKIECSQILLRGTLVSDFRNYNPQTNVVVSAALLVFRYSAKYRSLD